MKSILSRRNSQCQSSQVTYRYTSWRRFNILESGVTNDYLASKGLSGWLGNKRQSFQLCFGRILLSDENVQLHFNYIDFLNLYGKVVENKVCLVCSCPFYK